MARARPTAGRLRQPKSAQRFGPAWLARHLGELLPGRWPEVRLCVALSGGLDSSVLLAALASVRPRPAGLRAVHIDHGLRPDARAWSRHCRHLARRLRVPLTVLRARIECPPGASLEAVARDHRYALLARQLRPQEVLLSAHQQDDQLETVLLQLLRGSGLPGLAAMPERATFAAGLLVRPLLPCARADLEAWAQAAGLTWVEDDSNRDTRFDRNYLRQRIVPAVLERWPGAARAVARSARHVAEAQSMLEELGRADVEGASVGAALSAAALRRLTPERRRNALRYWLTVRGVSLPDTMRLRELSGPVLEAREDAQPLVRWGEVCVRRGAGLLRIESGPVRAPGERTAPEVVTWRWRDAPRCELADGSVLVLQRDGRGPIDLERLPEALEVGRRRGGERLRPKRRGPSRALKNLLQEAQVPPADRARLPLLCAAGKVLLVPDRWVDAAVQATPATRQRGRVRWLAPRAPTARRG